MASPAVTTSIDEVKADSFEPRTIEFGKDVEAEINHFLERHIKSRLDQLRNIHTSSLAKWNRIAEGRPREKNRSFPFEGASNLVHQTAGEAIDDLAARVLQLTWMTSPIVMYRYFTGAMKQDVAEQYSRRAKELIQFMDYVSYDPRELNLYPRENKWWYDGAKHGRAWVIVAPENRVEAVYTGYSEKKKKATFENKTLYEGPEVINADYEDILYDPDVKVFEKTDPLFRRCTLTLSKIRERVFKGTWRKADAEKIMEQPDQANEVKQREKQKKGIIDTPSNDQTLATWEVFECYFSWWHNDKKHRLMAWYHLKTRTIANCVYNFIPDNQVPILETRLTVDGRGFPDILEHYQEEISTAKNQRNDTITVSMWGINTVDPSNKTLGPNFRLAPNVFLPVKKDQFMHYDVGNAAFAGLSLENEQAMIAQAKERAGVGPAMSGMGAGAPNKKGQYSAMGTLSVMQDGNSRNDHRTSDFRHSHVALMSMLTDFYGFLGLGRKGTTFGLDDELLNKALEDYLSRKMRIPTRAASASLNREISKQSQIILNQAHSMYVKETSSQLQALMNETLPLEYREWLLGVVKAKTMLMQQIFKDFQVSDNPAEYVPDIEYKIQKPQQPQGGVPQNAAPQQAGPIPISTMAPPPQGPGEGGVPLLGSGMGGVAGGPPR